MQKLTVNRSIVFFFSFLITLFLFFVAGNLIFVEQPASMFTALDSIKFSAASNNKLQVDNDNATSQVINTEKTKGRNSPSASQNISETVPSKLHYSSNEKDTKQLSIFTLEGDYFPLFKLKPDYPSHALEKGREGVCLVNYTIETNGKVRNVTAVDSECDVWFRKASIDAAKLFVYKPRVKNGMSVKVENVRNKFVFKILEK